MVEKTTKARGPGHLQGKAKPYKTPAAAYNIEEWMSGLEGDSGEEPKRNNNDKDCGPDDKVFMCNVLAKEEGDKGGREPPGFLGTLQEAHPPWEEVWICRVNKVPNIQTR